MRWWRRADWWDRSVWLLIAVAGACVVAAGTGWRPPRWPAVVATALSFAYVIVWLVRSLWQLRVMERRSRARQAEFDARLRAWNEQGGPARQ